MYFELKKSLDFFFSQQNVIFLSKCIQNTEKRSKLENIAFFSFSEKYKLVF